MITELNFLGHSGFYINAGGTGILVDPFISQNPVVQTNFDETSVKYIFVTHAHTDHLGDAIPIAKATNATIVTIFELANYCEKRGASVIGAGLGGTLEFDWGKVRFVPAAHSSSTVDGAYAGSAAGIIFEIGKTKIYHAGDTALSSEMQVIGEIYRPDIALLPIGSVYTMGIDEAVIAAKWLGASTIIPIHYNTFDLINADVNDFKRQIELQKKKCIIMQPGEKILV